MTRNQFFHQIDQVRQELIGYTEEELQEIARVYDIRIVGQLADFLRIMGRSDGGLIGDYYIQLYRSRWSPGDQLDFQLAFHDEMMALGFSDFLKKPFVVAWLSENQYFFVQTTSEQTDKIYHFNENEETADETEWDLFGFIASLMEDRKNHNRVRTVGQLLELD